MTYAEKLKDPRWQKKRLEILQRDEWYCQRCGDTESTLHVHHKRYIHGLDPWDYDEKLLITLCESCHEYERAWWNEVEPDLIGRLHELFFADDLHDLTTGFINGECQHVSSVVASAIAWAFQNDDVQKQLVTRYLESITKSK